MTTTTSAESKQEEEEEGKFPQWFFVTFRDAVRDLLETYSTDQGLCHIT
jgi:hypothetical protein